MLAYPVQLVHAYLIKRYKRFLADVRLDDGSIVTVHCTNSGSMKSCIEEGAEVFLSPASNPKRKTRFTWEMILINGHWIGINTMLPNLLVYQSIKENQIPGLENFPIVKREVKFSDSRFDIYLENDHEKCFVEVKNVTMKVGEHALFPDAVTIRGRKHLETLIKVKNSGMRALMIYVIQRVDVDKFGIAKEIDPDYFKSFLKAMNHGVEIIPIQLEVKPQGVQILKELPLIQHI
jgi:sugar fermentation stimulation protein A